MQRDREALRETMRASTFRVRRRQLSDRQNARRQSRDNNLYKKEGTFMSELEKSYCLVQFICLCLFNIWSVMWKRRVFASLPLLLPAHILKKASTSLLLTLPLPESHSAKTNKFVEYFFFQKIFAISPVFWSYTLVLAHLTVEDEQFRWWGFRIPMIQCLFVCLLWC